MIASNEVCVVTLLIESSVISNSGICPYSLFRYSLSLSAWYHRCTEWLLCVFVNSLVEQIKDSRVDGSTSDSFPFCGKSRSQMRANIHHPSVSERQLCQFFTTCLILNVHSLEPNSTWQILKIESSCTFFAINFSLNASNVCFTNLYNFSFTMYSDSLNIKQFLYPLFFSLELMRRVTCRRLNGFNTHWSWCAIVELKLSLHV